jgi:hypothetical protein
MGRPRKQEIELTGTERASLRDLVRSRTAGLGSASADRTGLGSGRLKHRDRLLPRRHAHLSHRGRGRAGSGLPTLQWRTVSAGRGAGRGGRRTIEWTYRLPGYCREVGQPRPARLEAPSRRSGVCDPGTFVPSREWRRVR